MAHAWRTHGGGWRGCTERSAGNSSSPTPEYRTKPRSVPDSARLSFCSRGRGASRLAARRARLPARRVRGGVRRAGAGPLLAPCGGLVCKWMGVASATHAPPGHPHPRSGRAKCRTSNPPIDRIEATPRTSSAGQPRHRRGSRARYSLSLRLSIPPPPHNTSHTSKASATMADYVIRNGLIVDGTGSAPCVSTAARCFLRSPAQFVRRC
eukprot:COSAG04_NODE_5387_length_1634_cov_1.373290_2_plen_209_part_00